LGRVLGSKVGRDEGCVPAGHEYTFTHFACKGLCFGNGTWQQGRQGRGLCDWAHAGIRDCKVKNHTHHNTIKEHK